MRTSKNNPKPKPVFVKPPLRLQTTTLWDFPSQHYGTGMQGDKNYAGATPSYLIWNLLKRYTKENDLVLDPMCGSGTTLDVCRDLKRQGLGFDLAPYRDDIQFANARHLPLKNESVDFIFVDPPYSTHIRYSGDPRCLGELSANDTEYYEEMSLVITEMHRVLKTGGFLGLYISDSFVKDQPFMPIGFEIFSRLKLFFQPVDIVSVVRHNQKLEKGNFHMAAEKHNFFLRGFNYLFIMKKSEHLTEAILGEKERAKSKNKRKKKVSL